MGWVFNFASFQSFTLLVFAHAGLFLFSEHHMSNMFEHLQPPNTCLQRCHSFSRVRMACNLNGMQYFALIFHQIHTILEEQVSYRYWQFCIAQGCAQTILNVLLCILSISSLFFVSSLVSCQAVARRAIHLISSTTEVQNPSKEIMWYPTSCRGFQIGHKGSPQSSRLVHKEYVSRIIFHQATQVTIQQQGY